MHRLLRGILLTAIALIAACSNQDAFAPKIANTVSLGLNESMPVRISEFHYDNTGTDAGEAVEISGPAGTSLTGYSIVLYNGSGGAVYDTDNLTGTIPNLCNGRGVVVLNYPSNGIQNGAPDGIALVGPGVPGPVVIEFLSYEGSFNAVGGAANGMASTDIGVFEAGTESASPVTSLKRNGATTIWSGPSPNNFGACNDDLEPVVVDSVEVTPSSATATQGGTQLFTAAAFDAAQLPIPGVTFTWTSTVPAVATVNAAGVATGIAPGDASIIAAAPNGEADTASLHVDPAPPPGGGTARFSEIHYDNVSTDVGEAIEVEGDAGTSLTGWSIVLYNGGSGTTHGRVYSTTPLAGSISATCGDTGVVVVNYPVNGIQNGHPDGFALVNASAQVVQFLAYGSAFTAVDGPAAGMTAVDIEEQESTNTPVGNSLQRDRETGRWFGPVAHSFGSCNPPPPPPFISFSGRLFTDPPLPVGFEDQLFANLINAFGDIVPTTFTWSSDTPLLASIDQDGVMHGLSAGTAIFRATATDLTTRTWSLPIAVATLGGTAQYGNNIEFGQPNDGNPVDDIIINRDQFKSSFNAMRGIPNWVSYNLDASHFGARGSVRLLHVRSAALVGLTPYNTADYTGAAAFAGFGIDRGHLARSFDRTSGSLDNAYTYLFTNIIPQASDNNQGPWAIMENFLGDQARFQNKEVYVIAGAGGHEGHGEERRQDRHPGQHVESRGDHAARTKGSRTSRTAGTSK